MSALLVLENVTAGYGAKIIVRDVSFELNKGELCALVGLNGSGKTTLLKAVCGLLPIMRGSSRVTGKDSVRLKENHHARYISYIPQRHSKLIGVSVLDVVIMGYYSQLGFLEFPSHVQRKAALESLEKMGLGHLAEEDFSRLSEGQKQLVILTRTLVQNTPVMLMDEPDSALDFKNSYRIMGVIRQLVQSEGKAALVSLHDPNLALAYCDRLIFMSDGKIVSIISIHSTSLTDIEAALSEIYSGVTVQLIQGQYVVMQAGN